jgi:hypothetical protein
MTLKFHGAVALMLMLLVPATADAEFRRVNLKILGMD